MSDLKVRNRQRIILDQLDVRGAFSYQELSERLGVSTMTVRRDVDQLATQGLVLKTLGGVQKADAPSYFYETPLQSRISVHRAEKRAIAEEALKLVRSEQTLFLDGSTTCQQLAKQLVQHRKDLTIVTNSACVSLILGESSENMIVCIGGQFDKDTASFVGPSSEESAHKFFVDIAFISTKGFLPLEGTFESSVSNLRIKQIIAEQSANLTLLVDHSKFGVRALCKAIDPSQIHQVVTNDATPDEFLECLKTQEKDVFVAAVKNHNLEDAASAS